MPDQPVDRLGQRISVVLLTYNCAHRIEPILDRLGKLDLPLIAVDNGSADGTADVLAKRPEIEVIRLSRNIGAAGRNVGADSARTPYVLFCDDDGWYEQEALEGVCDLFDAHPELALVNARIAVGAEEELDPISAEMADSPLPASHDLPGTTLLGFMAGAVAVRRSAYQEAGGYDHRFFIGGEEETLAVKLARAGWQMRYLPEFVMHHEPSLANALGLRAMGMRNTLVNTWLHRPWRSALRWTVFTLADNPKNADWLRAIAWTLRALPWIVRERDPMDAELDAQLTVLDRRRFANRRPVFTYRGWQPGDPLRPQM
ncbi:MAG TPA: glycosyltransferase [Jatrophihabitans sp.]|nr:glycosyltransferase [Jatrophihabitans sp.]